MKCFPRTIHKHNKVVLIYGLALEMHHADVMSALNRPRGYTHIHCMNKLWYGVHFRERARPSLNLFPLNGATHDETALAIDEYADQAHMIVGPKLFGGGGQGLRVGQND